MPTPGDIALQIMWNRLIAVVEEQSQTLLRNTEPPARLHNGGTSAVIADFQLFVAYNHTSCYPNQYLHVPTKCL